MAPESSSPKRPYHHGNLRRELLDAAIEVISEVGAAGMSMREVARRAGVSSAAPAHHFGDRTGLLTALAAEGHQLLAAAMTTEYERSGNFLEVGVAYVRFAIDHRSHFDVMFRPELHDPDDPELRAGRTASASMLFEPAALASRADEGRTHDAGIAAWSLVHGLANLILSGNLPDTTSDPDELTRHVAGHLFARPPSSGAKR